MEKIVNLIKNNKLIFSLIGIIICLIIILIINLNKSETLINENEYEYVLKLFGDSKIVIEQYEKYVDPGYYATLNNINVSDDVLVLGEVNTNKPGNYQITYLIGDQQKVRDIVVLEKEVEEIINFKLMGEDSITINLYGEYQELGVIATNQDGKDLSNEVNIQNNIQNDKVGVYYVYYYLEYNNEKYELKREIKVIEPLKIIINYDKENYYQELNLNIKVLGSNFEYLKLPNQVVTSNTSTTYKIKENGIYTFYVYDKSGNMIEESITISNIDKEIDSASCILNVKVKSSEIVINASDKKSGIDYYRYNGIYYNNTININSRQENAQVEVFDKAGNSKSINCRVNILEEVYGFILIGDSRFVGMETYLGDEKRINDTFVAKWAMGWNWFLDTAIDKVTEILKDNPDRKYYILCNLGINDFKNHYDDANYAKKLSELASNEWKDHIVGYISTNPYADIDDSRNRNVEAFNKRQKSDMKGIYYCDTYNGIGLSNFEPKKSTDTIHYNKKTSLAIYNYIINNCAF